MSNRYQLDALESRSYFATLAPGQTVLSSISSVGQAKTWTVPLVAGRNITLAAGDRGTSSFATELTLLNSSGQVVATNSGDKGAFISTTAPTTGTYTVRVRDVGNNQKGDFRLTAFYYASSITDSDDAFAAESGRRRPATIEPGDLDVWTVSMKSGQFLSVVATENNVGSSIGVGVTLIGPNGKIVQSKTSEKGIKIDVAGTLSGKYYAVVHEPGQNATGRYGISFAITPGAQYPGDPDTATPLAPGVTRNGDLPGGDIDVWNINLAAGKTISATLSRAVGSLEPELLLIDPKGKVVASANSSTSATITFKTTVSGVYSLVARDREADDGGRFDIRYTVA